MSIVIEWENARLSEAQRSLRMLNELARQLDIEVQETSREIEILVLHNSGVVEREAIEALICEVRPLDAWPTQVRLLASGGRLYYEQKNFGAANSVGDIVLFLDSDVVPEPGWLHSILATFADSEVSVVSGSTYVEPGSFYERAVALFWLFPLRSASNGVANAQSFWANNVAFRRHVIVERGFPELPTFRGQCGLLARNLRDEGLSIVRCMDARVSHPPPNGLRHFVSRAMASGHDDAVRDRLGGRKLLKPALKDFWRHLVNSTRRISREHHQVDLSPLGAVGAWWLALAYYLCKLAGRMLTNVDAGIVRRYFPI